MLYHLCVAAGMIIMYACCAARTIHVVFLKVHKTPMPWHMQQSTREQEFQRQAASMASASSSKSGGGSKPTKSVTIRNVATTTFGSATTVVPQLVIPDGVGEPTAIHGGILLGVSVSGGGEKEVEKLLLYDWNGGLLTAGVLLSCQCLNYSHVGFLYECLIC